MSQTIKKVVGALEDLMFSVQVQGACKSAGWTCVFPREEARILELLKEQPGLMVVDLSHRSINTVELIRKVKASAETSGIRILAFVPHVQVELRAQALEAGADEVVPRSIFAQHLPKVLAAIS